MIYHERMRYYKCPWTHTITQACDRMIYIYHEHISCNHSIYHEHIRYYMSPRTHMIHHKRVITWSIMNTSDITWTHEHTWYITSVRLYDLSRTHQMLHEPRTHMIYHQYTKGTQVNIDVWHIHREIWMCMHCMKSSHICSEPRTCTSTMYYVYTYVYIHIHICVYIYIYVHTSTYIQIYWYVTHSKICNRGGCIWIQMNTYEHVSTANPKP